MAEITLIVDPGADDIIIDGVSLNAIDAFRDECLSGEAVSCDWDTLHTRLISHDISRFWWFLTEVERRSIAEHAIKNTISGIIWYFRKGATGEWASYAAPCGYNAIIRSQWLGTPNGWHDCYWKYDVESDVFHYVTDEYYSLPTVHVNTATHVMCGIQVVNSIDDLDNWVVFQYSATDIKPGNPQMPYGKHVIIQDPFPYPNGACAAFDSTVITEFDV